MTAAGTLAAIRPPLFNSLLDISRLDAGALAPPISEFPVDYLLKRIETTFVATARESGLRLRVVSSRAWVRSDFILLERILLNLVSNAVRYTERGGVVIGCRHRNGRLRIDVWDSGIGVPEDQRCNIFGEFYQLDGGAKDRLGELGLGLAIVDRLCGLPLWNRLNSKSDSLLSLARTALFDGSCGAIATRCCSSKIAQCPLRAKLRIGDPRLHASGMYLIIRSACQ